MAQPVLEYADPLLNQITAAQNNDRSRIVLGLNKAAQYNTEVHGNEVWVFVTESSDRTTTSAAISNNANARQKAGSSEAVKQTVNSANIDFRKGAHKLRYCGIECA